MKKQQQQQQLQSVKRKMTAEGLILGIIGFILFFDFMSVDASIFGYQSPQIIQHLSRMFQVSPIVVDILTTIGLLMIISMLRTEKEEGRLEK
jgi:hypothetical protein